MSNVIMERIEIAPGRHLAIKRFGDPNAERVLLFDPGSFGSFVDGIHLCQELASRGWRAITYSRAGLMPSDAMPRGERPDPRFHVEDMARLLDGLNISRPIILAGHSMAGVRLHFAGHTIRERLAGLVFLDAVCPSLTKSATWGAWTQFASSVAGLGIRVARSQVAPFVEQFHPNALKLSGEDRAIKLRSVTSPEHLKAAAEEVRAMDRRTRIQEITEATHLPALFVTATNVSQGTSQLLKRYREAGTYAQRIHLKNEGHISMLTPPSVATMADGIDHLWAEVSAAAKARGDIHQEALG